MFYQGLKNNIKNELIKNERLKKLAEMVKKSIKINNRFIER